MTAANTRTIGGLALPAQGAWTIDATHSAIEFSVRHLGFSKVRGRFGAFAGGVLIGEDPADSVVQVEIDVDSIDTRLEKRDNHLRSSDFFEIESFPKATFRSTSLQGEGARWQITGELAIRGVSREVILESAFEGMATDRQNRSRAAFSASTKVDREDFNLTWNQTLETGGIFLGNEINIELDVQLVYNEGLERVPHYAIPVFNVQPQS